MSQFRYSPLSSDFDSIRLLRLLPHRDKAADIQCQLFDYSLHESHGTHLYEALSYAWGDPNEILPIFVHGNPFNVTINLHAALLRLRNHFVERILWIDAICINQADDKEKENQIQFMAKIYSHANRVVVWLGETADDSDLAFEEIRSVRGKRPDDQPLDSNVASAVLALLQRPWFRRIWILQEVAAARGILIMCGYKKLDGVVFCLGIDCSVSYHTHPHIQNLVYSSSYLIREAIFRPEYSLGSSGRNFLSICPLGGLVDMYHAHEATKRHDKVYALLGMSSDDLSEAGLLPNYARPWEDVLQQLVRHLIPESRSIQTWANEEIAVFQSPGYVLGMVKAVSINTDRGDRYRVEVSSMHIPEQLQQVFENGHTWTIQASAKTVREGDFICIFKGASRPSIIRVQKDYFTVIMVAVPFSDEREKEHDPIEWSMLSLSSRFPSRSFLLVWNWEESPKENTDLSDSEDTDLEENTNAEKDTGPEEYETWLQRNEDTRELSKLDATYHLARATRAWNVMLIFGDTVTKWVFRSQMNNRNRKQADKHGRESIRSFDIAMRKAWPLALECRSNQTSLDCAEREHYKTIVSLLHEFYRLTLDSHDKDYGPLPLLWAAQGGYEAVIKVLLDVRNIDPNVTDQNGRTPLWWAADKGHEAVVQLLLATGKVDIQLQDSRSHNTPLHCAALRGHGGVVQLLLDTGMVDVDLKNGGREQTPLLLAAKEGHECVFKLLLETGRVDINATDRNMLTSLWWAADRGHSTIVQMLLDTGKLNVDPKAITTTRGISFGSTPLHCAARSGHSIVVQLLLETGKVDVNYAGGREQQTPLSIAAENGHEAVVAMLLRISNVKLNLRNEYSYSPLQLAARNGHERVVKLLLGADKIQIDEKNWRGETPWSLATKYRHENVVQLLIDSKNNHAQLLEQPASGGCEGVAEPL